MLWAIIPCLVIFIVVFLNSSFIIQTLLNYYGISVNSLTPSEGVVARMNLGLVSALVFFIPLFLYQIIGFMGEAIPNKIKKSIKTKMAFVFILAIFGLLAGITIFSKMVLNGLIQYNIGNSVWGILSVISLVSTFGLILALSIQTIWFIPFITKMDIISKKTLSKSRPFLFVGLLIASAIITPPDVISQMLVMIPLYGSFEVGMLLTKYKEEVET